MLLHASSHHVSEWLDNPIVVWWVYFFYMAIATTFVPLPTQPAPLFMGKHFDPVPVALVGALGAACSHFVEYHVAVRFMKLSWFQKYLQHPKFARFEPQIRNHLFLGLLFSAATGLIPSDLVRLITMIARYNPFKACLAILIGRIPRYYVWAKLSEEFQFPTSIIALVFVGLLALMIIQWKWRKKILNQAS